MTQERMTDDDELVERMAEAIFAVSNGRHAGTRDETTWTDLDGFGEIGATVKANVRAKARAALAVAEPVILKRAAAKLEAIADLHRTAADILSEKLMDAGAAVRNSQAGGFDAAAIVIRTGAAS